MIIILIFLVFAQTADKVPVLVYILSFDLCRQT